MNAMIIARALIALRPEIFALVKTLLERFDGDVPSVAREMRRIADHGARGEDKERGFEARVAAARAKRVLDHDFEADARARPAAAVAVPPADDEDDGEDPSNAPTATTRREPS